MKVLVVDIGGTNVKLMISARAKRRKFASGPGIRPAAMLRQLKALTTDWDYDTVSIGFPAPVRREKIIAAPKHLGSGWIGFDFSKEFGKPVKIINDAALQALGSYRGGRMLFIGLGTGLGSALVLNKIVLPLELSELPVDGANLESRLCEAALKKSGVGQWEREVFTVLTQLKTAFIADEIVVGGGNAKLLTRLPDGVRRGHNRNAFLGGCRLWQKNPNDSEQWTVL
jgi:hypothetical protein